MERSCGDLIPALSFYCVWGKSLGEDLQQYVGACQGHTDIFRNSQAPKCVSKYVHCLVLQSTILNLSVMRSYWMPAGTPLWGMEFWLGPGDLSGKWQKLCSSGKMISPEAFPSLTSKMSYSARAQPSCPTEKKSTSQIFFFYLPIVGLVLHLRFRSYRVFCPLRGLSQTWEWNRVFKVLFLKVSCFLYYFIS